MLDRTPSAIQLRLQELEQQLRERDEEITQLSEAVHAVNSELNIDTVFQLVCQHAQNLINAETVLIPLLDYECQKYTYRAGYGKNAEEIVGESLPLDFGVCGWVWRHKRPWWRGVLNELEPEEKNRWESEVGHIILMPLFGKRHFLGGIAGMNKIGGGDFTRRDLDLLTLFASQVSIAIENATYFKEIDSARKQAEAYQLELQKLNTDLENRVEKRTAELAGANVQLQKMALHDSLTGLANRTLIMDRLKYGISQAKRYTRQVSIIMMDLDRFKEINDTLGHYIGDQLLVEIAARLSAALRESDTVGRLGGDEFAIVLPDAAVESAVLVAAKITRALEAPLTLEGNTLSISGSLGIATYPDHGDNEINLLKFSDVAMYAAKRTNSGYCVYDARTDSHNHKRLAFVSELRECVTESQFELHYQPQIDMTTGRIRRVEALARWPHATQGMIPPDIFIPELEKTGLIKAFTFWALDTALGQWANWRKNNIFVGTTMSVNLSMHNLSDPGLPAQLADLLTKWNIDANSLMLEITESSIMRDPDQVIRTLLGIRQTGVKFSIDDFGTGYSSLTYLKQLPVSELKIDKSFVMEMTTNENDSMIVLSTIYLAHNLGLEVVAEGVENKETFNALCDLKCDIAQGYHISKPLPADQLAEFAKARELTYMTEKSCARKSQ